MNGAQCAFRCFYREHLKLGLTWTVSEELRIAPPQTPPLREQQLEQDEATGVTFRYRDHDGPVQRATVSGSEFVRRVLQHVLPKGFQRMRHYGWRGAAAQAKWARILALLDWRPPALVPPRHSRRQLVRAAASRCFCWARCPAPRRAGGWRCQFERRTKGDHRALAAGSGRPPEPG